MQETGNDLFSLESNGGAMFRPAGFLPQGHIIIRDNCNLSHHCVPDTAMMGTAGFCFPKKNQVEKRVVGRNKNGTTSTSEIFLWMVHASRNCMRFISFCVQNAPVFIFASVVAKKLKKDCFTSWNFFFFRQCSRTTPCYSYQMCWRCFWRMGRSSPSHLIAVPLLGYVYTFLK